jgi:hypothetical protein
MGREMTAQGSFPNTGPGERSASRSLAQPHRYVRLLDAGLT